MTTFTAPALLAYILAHNCVPAAIAPVMVGIALHENHALDTDAVNHNANGTDDFGLAQVNTVNFQWTGLTRETARDPCHNIHAGMMVLFARYNGAPPDLVKARYAAGAEAAIRGVEVSGTEITEPIQPTCTAQSWDVWAVQSCRDSPTHNGG